MRSGREDRPPRLGRGGVRPSGVGGGHNGRRVHASAMHREACGEGAAGTRPERGEETVHR